MSDFTFHISLRRLVDLAEGRLPPEERVQALAHISACSRCAETMAWLERTTGLMWTDLAEDAPPQVIADAVRLFRTRARQASPEKWKRVLAVLRFDSAQLPLALGMRAGRSAARQLLFSLGEGEYELDLEVAPAGERWTVSGQVLGPGGGGQVELRGATGAAQADLSDLSEFTLPPVPAGSYTMIITLADLEAEVKGLELGA